MQTYNQFSKQDSDLQEKENDFLTKIEQFFSTMGQKEEQGQSSLVFERLKPASFKAIFKKYLAAVRYQVYN
jgi:hypothetical protein